MKKLKVDALTPLQLSVKRIKRAFPEVNIDNIFFAIDSNISAVELLENEKTPMGSQA